MSFDDRNVCVCTEMGCASKTFELYGVLRTGVNRNAKNAKAHRNNLERIRRPPPREPEMLLGPSDRPMPPQLIRRRSSSSENSRSHAHSSTSTPIARVSQQRRRSLSLNNLQATHSGNPLAREVFSTEKFRMQQVYLQEPECLIRILTVAKANIVHRASQDECRELLKLGRLEIEQTCRSLKYEGTPFWKQIPTTLPSVYRSLNLQFDLEATLCCPECYALHGPAYPPTEADFKSKCDSMRFLESTTKRVKGQPKPKVYRSKCGATLYNTTGKKPNRIFYSHSLKEWLARMMLLQGFEENLDSSLNHQENSLYMLDIWDGQMWKTFQDSGRAYTSISGNLVFGLYGDWFHPFGNSARRQAKTGNLLLICFNLPPEIRYKQENMFLFGTIPGPTEPDVEQMNHLLRPLVNQFLEFWDGIFFTSTAKYPEGRLIRCALWPLIADLVAMRKIAGFASHSATFFCVHCLLERLCISETNICKWPPRLDVRKLSEEWRDAETLSNQQTIFEKHGVRYSVLLDLPYWKPKDFVTIDIMHCIPLGILKDHATSCLGIRIAGQSLTKKHKSNAARGIHNRFERESNTSAMASDSDLPEGYRGDTDQPLPRSSQQGSSIGYLTSSSNPGNLEDFHEDKTVENHAKPIRYHLRSRVTEISSHTAEHSNLDKRSTAGQQSMKRKKVASRNNSSDSCGAHDQSSKKRKESVTVNSPSKDSTSELRGTQIRTSHILESAEDGTDSDHTARRASPPLPKKKSAKMKHPPGPVLAPDDLTHLHWTIANTITPTWMTRIPTNIGLAKAGTPKASEWLSLYTVYMVLSIIPDMYESSLAGSQAICLSIIKLVEIVNSVFSKAYLKNDGDKLQESIQSFRNHMQSHWKNVSIKPNMHLMQHLPDLAKQYGPPCFTAGWAGERMNGFLGKIPKNQHQDDLDKTLCEAYMRRGMFQTVLQNTAGILRKANRSVQEGVSNALACSKAPKWTEPRALDRIVFEIFKDLLQHHPERYNGISNTPNLFQTIKQLHILGKPFGSDKVQSTRSTRYENQGRNSLVEYSKQGQKRIGVIQHFFQTPSITSVFVLIKPYMLLTPEDNLKNCFKNHPGLHATLVYERLDAPVVVDIIDLCGHIALVKNKSGAFRINSQTLAAVSLRNLSLYQSDTES